MKKYFFYLSRCPNFFISIHYIKKYMVFTVLTTAAWKIKKLN